MSDRITRTSLPCLLLALALLGATTAVGEDVTYAPKCWVKDIDGRRPQPRVVMQNGGLWPTLMQLGDGTLLVMGFNHPSHSRGAGEPELWASTDGGRTWKFRSRPVPHDPDLARGGLVTQTPGGDLLCLSLAWSNKPVEGQTPVDEYGFRMGMTAFLAARSSDAGRTWTIDPDGFPKPPEGGMHGYPMGTACVGRDGTMRWPFGSIVLTSRDDGRTWGEPAPLDTSGTRSVNESTILHLGDGVWLAGTREARDLNGTEGMNLYRSEDDGRTWTWCYKVSRWQRYPGHLAQLADGRVILTYSDRIGAYSVQSVSAGVDVIFSDDAGRTWSDPIRVGEFIHDGGYPMSVQRADGRVVTSYYAEKTTTRDGYHAAVVIWDPDRSLVEKREGDYYRAPVKAELVSSAKVWDAAPHNGATDLWRFKDRWYCVLREGRAALSTDGRIRVLVSPDARAWTDAGLIELPGYDLRAPHLSQTPQGWLMLTGGAAQRPSDGAPAATGTFVSYSKDGVTWSQPRLALEPGRTLGAVTWHGGTAYAFSYGAGLDTKSTSIVSEIPQSKWYTGSDRVDLMSSPDGLSWTVRTEAVCTEGSPTESRLRFGDRGRAIALIRRDIAGAVLGRSTGHGWRLADLDASLRWEAPDRLGDVFYDLAGPNLIETEKDCWIASGRLHMDEDYIGLMHVNVTDSRMQEILALPSGGDCGYAGLAWHDGLLYVSYYSSHEGKPSVYLAQVRVEPAGIGALEASHSN